MAEAPVEIKSRRLTMMMGSKEATPPSPTPSNGLGDVPKADKKSRPVSMSISTLPDSLKEQIHSNAGLFSRKSKDKDKEKDRSDSKETPPVLKSSVSFTSISSPSSPAAAPASPASPATTAGAASADRLPAIPLVCCESKGKEVTLNLSPSLTVQEAMIEFNNQLQLKSFDKLAPYMKDSNIYLAPSRTLASYLIKPNDKITLTKPSKEKKTFYLTVVLPDNNEKEVIECSPEHSVWAVIQMLSKRIASSPSETFHLFKDGQKVPADTKLSTAGIKGAVPVEVRKAAVETPTESPSEARTKKSSKEDKKEKKEKERNRKSTMLSSPVVVASVTTVEHSSRSDRASSIANFLLHRPTKEDLIKKNIMSKVEADAATASITPLKFDIFKQLCEFLEPHIEMQGIFRISGGLQDVRSLYLQFGTSTGPLDFTTARADPNVATGALKLYLREQKDPLIPFSIYAEFLKAQRLKDPAAQLNAIRVAISKLPELNGSILKLLMEFLRRVAAKESVNLMGPGNLGIVFGPTIMWDPDTSSLNFENTNVQSALVGTMIVNFDSLWGEGAAAATTAALAAASASPASPSDSILKPSKSGSALNIAKRSATVSSLPGSANPSMNVQLGQVHLKKVDRSPSATSLAANTSAQDSPKFAVHLKPVSPSASKTELAQPETVSPRGPAADEPAQPQPHAAAVEILEEIVQPHPADVAPVPLVDVHHASAANTTPTLVSPRAHSLPTLSPRAASSSSSGPVSPRGAPVPASPRKPAATPALSPVSEEAPTEAPHVSVPELFKSILENPVAASKTLAGHESELLAFAETQSPSDLAKTVAALLKALAASSH